MNINYSLAIVLRDFLKKHNIEKQHQDFTLFSEDELNQITELELTNLDNLEDLDKLPNLKKLAIKSENYNNFATYIELENSTLINHITDFSKIEKLPNLEELEIINDINIKKLDLGNLPNLKKIYLINNPNLSNVKNLDKLKKLKKVIIYGTNIKNSLNIHDYLVNTYKTKINILDINMYDSIVKGSSKNSKALADLYKLGFTKIHFAEKTGFADFALLSIDKVDKLYQKCLDIIKEKQLRGLSNYDKIKHVYQYVTNNITFDQEGIIARNKQYLELKYNYKDIPPFIKNNFSMLHSSYNAGILRKSNCEGYVNLMNFMLGILNIQTASVYATDKNNPNVASYNHALTSVELNGDWYYCEPTWEKPGELKYFMKTYDEIIKTHVLNPFELYKNKEVNLDVANYERNRKCR